MEVRRPMPGEFYRHFKNKIYQILTTAKHSETGEELVVYQAMYGEFGIYARPLAMFVSEVDREKYLDVAQKYRFEKVNTAEQAAEASPQEAAESEVKPQAAAELKADLKSLAEKESLSEHSTEEGADSRLLRFLDADTYQEKYKVLQEMESDITDRLINDFAVILDVVIPEGALSDRYEQLKQCTATHARYENVRLR